MTQKNFKFQPQDRVYIMLDSKILAKVTRCIWQCNTVDDRETDIYEVEYVYNGELRKREFHSDFLGKVGI
jgi:hypothetical protein